MNVMNRDGLRPLRFAEPALRVGLVALVQLYRWVGTPLKVLMLGDMARCRFTPSCSTYALGAIQQHGAGVGVCLAARRICRCHPWGGHGVDLVPEGPV